MWELYDVRTASTCWGWERGVGGWRLWVWGWDLAFGVWGLRFVHHLLSALRLAKHAFEFRNLLQQQHVTHEIPMDQQTITEIH